MKFNITKYRNFYYAFSAFLFLVSLGSLVVFGIVPGIDFAGGSVLEVNYEEKSPSAEEIQRDLKSVGIERASVQLLGENSVLIRTDETNYQRIMGVLEGAERERFEAIGPTVGEELRNASIIAILVASLLIIAYIATSFREEDGSVSSVKYGVVATLVAFLHDAFIVLGIFSVLGYLYGVQVTIPIAVALLTTLGYSINDTVVIFDRIRENLEERKKRDENTKLETVVNNSLNATLGRSLSTSLTTLFILFAILFLGGATLFYFILALILGIILGMYSSIFLAGPLVLDWNELTARKR